MWSAQSQVYRGIRSTVASVFSVRAAVPSHPAGSVRAALNGKRSGGMGKKSR